MMDWLGDLGWRDGVIVIAGLAAIYLVLTVLRLLNVGRGSRRTEPATPVTPHFASEPVLDLSAEPAAAPAVPHPPAADSPTRHFAAAGATSWAGQPAPRAAEVHDFASELARSGVEREMHQLRRDSAALREELERVHQELSQLKAARNVSPLYSEAMALAQRGVTADGIAGQCGISLAEAELVAALARGRTDDPDLDTGEDPNGGHPDPRSRTGTLG